LHHHLGEPVDPRGEPQACLERLVRQRAQQRPLDRQELPDGPCPAADPPGLVIGVPGVDHRVERPDRLHLGNRDEVVAAEPADLPLDAAFLVGAADPGLAVEGVQAPVGAERGPPVGLHPRPAEPDDLRDRRLEVVIADLPGRHPAQDPERVLAALEERLLAARQRHAVHRLAG
jgi:hypothetical protein